MRRLILPLAALTLATAPLAAQLPAGWSARTDRDAPMANVKVATLGADGLKVTTGPAVILWKAAHQAAGTFTLAGTFTQTKAPEHAEAYGLFVGGKALTEAGQAYTYFIVRQDGKFMIRSRTGATTANVVAWTEHAAVAKKDAAGKATNTLSVAVAKDKATFSVNGTVVHTMTIAAGAMDGLAGVRVNHNLDLEITRLALTK